MNQTPTGNKTRRTTGNGYLEVIFAWHLILKNYTSKEKYLIGFYLFPGNGGKTSSPPGLRSRRLFAHVSQGRHPIIPFFQHSIIPINCERSELSS
jgi:hypothetical protein